MKEAAPLVGQAIIVRVVEKRGLWCEAGHITCKCLTSHPSQSTQPRAWKGAGCLLTAYTPRRATFESAGGITSHSFALFLGRSRLPLPLPRGRRTAVAAAVIPPTARATAPASTPTATAPTMAAAAVASALSSPPPAAASGDLHAGEERFVAALA